MSRLLERSIQVAEAYLQSAVIVDDRAGLGDSYNPPSILTTPGRQTARAPTASQAETIAVERRHNLDVKPLVDSFAERGIVCGVIAPAPGVSVTATTVRAAERADIVLLDWQINDDDGCTALSIISELMRKDKGERLRFIAIYTGEQTLTEIGEQIAEALRGDRVSKFLDKKRKVTIKHGHTRISIYAKSNSLPAHLRDRSVSEVDLPARVIEEFATMTNGLVPAIALTALAALRNNASRVLDKYHAGMDAPFLAHRACLPHPNDASRHLAAAIVAEAGCVMESDVHLKNPAGIDVVMDWVQEFFGDTPEFVFADNKKLDSCKIKALFDEGYDKVGMLNDKITGDRGKLTDVISGGHNNRSRLDLELAWLMSFRTVYDDSPPPILRLGTVVRKRRRRGAQDGSGLFLCMRPRCQCVRLDGAEQFHLLPLLNPPKEKTVQLPVPTKRNQYLRYSVSMHPSQWQLKVFAPSVANGPVAASREDGAGIFCFKASNRAVYEWVGELKPEFAQRIANLLAAQLSRVAVNNTEWLRRQENMSD
jgi:hypothetical protein